MGLLRGHDADLDVCRSYLMAGMIFAHVFFWFYDSYFNYHLTYHLTIGFVFISAFTMTAVYADRLKRDRNAASRRLAVRGAKLLAIYLAGNLVLIAARPARLAAIQDLGPVGIPVSILLGTRVDVFAFEILIPIGLFFLTAGVLTRAARHRALPPAVFLALLGLLVVSEYGGFLNHYGFKLYLIAGMSCMTVLILLRSDWTGLVGRLSRQTPFLVLSAFLVAAYFGGIALLSRGYVYHMALHLFPLMGILFLIYLLSHRHGLARRRAMVVINRILSGHMLFAYLFHLVLLNLLAMAIPLHGLDLARAFLLMLGVLGVTMGACELADAARRQWRWCDRAYGLVFK